MPLSNLKLVVDMVIQLFNVGASTLKPLTDARWQSSYTLNFL